jgi:hypothetical protein
MLALSNFYIITFLGACQAKNGRLLMFCIPAQTD